MTLQWLNHAEHSILLIDVSNLTNNHTKLTAELDALVALLKDEPLKSVLAVADLRNTYINNNVVMTLIKHAPLAAPHFRKSALVIEPNHARNIILNSLGQFVEQLPKRFDNLEDAKDWLVSQDKGKEPAKDAAL
jgi:hypothetical protein